MPNPSLVLPAILLGLAITLQPCHAQDGGAVNVRFLSFPNALDPVKVELRLAGETSMAITAPSNEFSLPFPIARPAAWVIGETVQAPDGKSVFREYARTTVPASPEQMLLIIRKGKENSDGFDLVAIDGQLGAFGGGKFLFMNATKVDIAGTVGDMKFAIKPGDHIVIMPAADGGGRTANAIFYFRKDDEARPFFSSRWPVNERSRNLVFFYHDPNSLRIRMHTIRDFL